MMKRVAHSTWISVLGLALVAPCAGCQADNEASIADLGRGTANPRYNSDATYKQYYKDQLQKRGETGKTKRASTARKKH